jgi:hypothetical protein
VQVRGTPLVGLFPAAAETWRSLAEVKVPGVSASNELTKNDNSHFSFFSLAHLARAAFLALALLSSGLSLAARLFPPFEPPIFPNATA